MGTASEPRGLRLATRIGFIWGWAWGQGRVRHERGLWVHRGLPPRLYPRGGVCVGRCFLTGPAPGAALLRHEAVHARQWERYGLSFPLRYWLAGRDPNRNRFEVEAGLVDGGYTS